MNLPPYPFFPNLKGEKIILRQVLHSDLQNLVSISYYDGIQATTIEEAAEMQGKINNDYNKGDSIHWGIADAATNNILGTCGYYRGLRQGEGELGCVLLPNYRGQGFMTGAMQLAINFGLREMGLNRIWAATSKSNIKAIQLLENLGFCIIAELRDDEIEYELTSSEKIPF